MREQRERLKRELIYPLTINHIAPRPPWLMVLNEPENSLYPHLLPALAWLTIRAFANTQVWVVSHSRPFIAALTEHPQCRLIPLEKDLGQTQIVGQRSLDEPGWYWPD